ncbi:MAG: radical SAM protein [Bacilli bacterium]
MKTKSIWGQPPTRLYRLMNLGKKEFNNNFTACIVGCSDGKFLMPFARENIKVTGYDIDDIVLYGGNKLFPLNDKSIKYKYSKDFISKEYDLEERQVIGVSERVKLENVESVVTLERRDFYRDVPNQKFDVVFTSCSLHYSANKDFSLEDKTRKLQSIVADNGYLYIDYMMAIDENDYETYPSSKFYRKNEILNYFDNNWDIISFRENHNSSFESAHVDCIKDHFHRFGYILAKKKRIIDEKEVCWNVTTRCNQNCKYCHRFLNINDLSLEQNKKVLENLLRSNISSITWTGGEALLLDGIEELLYISFSHGIKNKLITNGKLLDQLKIEKIGKYLDSITLSIDSIDSEINETLGRGNSHYQNIKKILDYLKNRNIKIRINSVVCSYNKALFKDLVYFLNNYDIYSWRLFKFMPLREKAIINKKEFEISLKDYINVIKLVKNESKIRNIDSRIDEDMEKKYILILADGSIVITENGFDKCVGNALKDDFDKVVF